MSGSVFLPAKSEDSTSFLGRRASREMKEYVQ
jgi:hypothetical protein